MLIMSTYYYHFFIIFSSSSNYKSYNFLFFYDKDAGNAAVERNVRLNTLV